MSYSTIDQIKQANARVGGCWFFPGTMRFFGSRVSAKLYGGRYFVISEKPPHGPRRYTVCYAADSGDIMEAGPFCSLSRGDAHRLARELAEAGAVPFQAVPEGAHFRNMHGDDTATIWRKIDSLHWTEGTGPDTGARYASTSGAGFAGSEYSPETAIDRPVVRID